MTVGLNDINLLWYAAEIEACERRLAHFKEHPSPFVSIEAYENDLALLRSQYAKLQERTNHG